MPGFLPPPTQAITLSPTRWPFASLLASITIHAEASPKE